MNELEAARARVRELEEKQQATQAELRAQYERDLAVVKQKQAEEVDALKDSFRRRGFIFGAEEAIQRHHSPEAATKRDLTIREVALELRISSNHVYQLIKSRRLAAYRASPRATRVRRDALEEFKRRRESFVPRRTAST